MPFVSAASRNDSSTCDAWPPAPCNATSTGAGAEVRPLGRYAYAPPARLSTPLRVSAFATVVEGGCAVSEGPAARACIAGAPSSSAASVSLRPIFDLAGTANLQRNGGHKGATIPSRTSVVQSVG